MGIESSPTAISTEIAAQHPTVIGEAALTPDIVTDVTSKINPEMYIKGHDVLLAAGLDADRLGSMIVGMGSVCRGTLAELMTMDGHAEELARDLLNDAKDAKEKGIDPNDVVIKGLGRFAKRNEETKEFLRVGSNLEEVLKKNKHK